MFRLLAAFSILTCVCLATGVYIYIYAFMGLITTWIHLLAVITHTHTRLRSLIAPVCGDHRALCVIYVLIKWWVIDLPGID